MCFKENKDNLRTINCKMLVAKRNNLIEMKVKYSRFRHNAKQTSFTSPTGPGRQGGEHEHVQYPTNDDITSGWSCRRPENVSILSSLMTTATATVKATTTAKRTAKYNYYSFENRVESNRNQQLICTCITFFCKFPCLPELISFFNIIFQLFNKWRS